MNQVHPDVGGPSDLSAPGWTWPFLFACFLVALFVRSWFAWDQVFAGAFVRFPETDPWYHLRLVESLLHNFPSPLSYDPYLKFPGGQRVNVGPALDTLVAAVSLVLGRGSPSPALVERVAAWAPPVLGALIVYPVYTLGRSIFTARTGLFAAGLIAVLPGPLMARSMLGFFDHHVAEALFSTVALALFVRALDKGHAPALAGVALAVYLATWSGGSLLVLALAVGVWIHLIVGHLRGDQRARRVVTPFVGTVATAAALVALVLWKFNFSRYHVVALLGSVVTSIALTGVSALMERREVKRFWYPVACGALLTGTLVLFWLAAPSFGSAVADQVRRLTNAPGMHVGEATPLFSSTPWWPISLFASFGLALPLAVLASIPAVLAAFRGARIGPLVLVVWFLFALAAMVGQARFAYYVAVPVAVLASFGCDRILDRSGKWLDLVFLLVIFLVFVPNAQLARAQAERPGSLSDDWHEALVWMRDHTPDPFGNPAVYLEPYPGMTEARPYPFPSSAYGVLSWWDPGYWILRIARRIPNTNPTQSNMDEAGRFFVATDEAGARSVLDRLDSRYIIVSSDMPAGWDPVSREPTGGYFPAMVAAARADERRYFETFYEPHQGGMPTPKRLYYADYYRSMVTRLYVYGGQSAEPHDSTYVAVYRDEESPWGGRLKMLVSLQQTASYAEAIQLVESHQGGNARIVGLDPFHTSVPVDALDTLTLVHASPTEDARAGGSTTGVERTRPTTVQIFEYHPERAAP